MGSWSRADGTLKGPRRAAYRGSRRGSRPCISPGLVVINLGIIICHVERTQAAFRRWADAGWRRSGERAVLVGTLAEICRCERAGLRGLRIISCALAAHAPWIGGILVARNTYPRESHWQVRSSKGVPPHPFDPPLARRPPSSSSAHSTDAFQPPEHSFAHWTFQCAPRCRERARSTRHRSLETNDKPKREGLA